ncbi:MAG: Rieske (2Fe-2S) protein [Deltaproteobacteria bacterium]|nr:Rieske (2Fe-2S) protein [Deltaproteobacteria bacterium]
MGNEKPGVNSTQSTIKQTNESSSTGKSRRDFLANTLMGTGLVVSHLFAGGLGLRYLYPAKKDRRQRLFVGLKSEIPLGTAQPFKTPQGTTVNVVHSTNGFIALSDVCPHLGCRVHWESQTNEFICPCHNGHFDASGAPTAGPPAEMGVGLSKYKVVVDSDVVFIEMRVTT